MYNQQQITERSHLTADVLVQQVEGRIVTAEQEQAEAVRLASGFVAAILASALADYVAQEAEGDQDGRTLVSTAQVSKDKQKS